jgi:hypothetical protein
MGVAAKDRPGVVVDDVRFFGDGLCEYHQFGVGLVVTHDVSAFWDVAAR